MVCTAKELARFQLNSNEMFYMIQMRCVLGYKILLIYHNFFYTTIISHLFDHELFSLVLLSFFSQVYCELYEFLCPNIKQPDTRYDSIKTGQVGFSDVIFIISLKRNYLSLASSKSAYPLFRLSKNIEVSSYLETFKPQHRNISQQLSMAGFRSRLKRALLEYLDLKNGRRE